MALPAETERNKYLERIALAVESIAKNLEKVVNPPEPQLLNPLDRGYVNLEPRPIRIID